MTTKPEFLYNPEQCSCISGAERGCPRNRKCAECTVFHHSRSGSYTACERRTMQALLERLPKVPIEGPWEENRAAIQTLLQREEFGFLPQVPVEVEGVVEAEDERLDEARALFQKVRLTLRWAEGSYSFPLWLAFPKDGAKATFLHIAFPLRDPIHVMPYEEIVARGMGAAVVYYTDITSDDDDFTNGLAGAWYQGRARAAEDPGKIALWAWALSKAMDYLATVPQIDAEKVAVVGHSRLGKTALCAGLMDERFALTISNDSGCAGAAINRGNQGESIEAITRVFPFWFDAHYQEYVGRAEEMPWDAHFLLAGIAPRRVYVASAMGDSWADPIAEQTSAEAARAVYEQLGLDRNHVGSHVRQGGHALSRVDWLRFMEYVEKYL